MADSQPTADQELYAGLVEWAQELGLTVIAPDTFSSSNPPDDAPGVIAPVNSLGCAVGPADVDADVYGDESFERDDDNDAACDDASSAADARLLSASSVRVWADSGPEVFGHASGAGDIEDD